MNIAAYNVSQDNGFDSQSSTPLVLFHQLGAGLIGLAVDPFNVAPSKATLVVASSDPFGIDAGQAGLLAAPTNPFSVDSKKASLIL